jgi:arabinose-5-phosphate isomerase
MLNKNDVAILVSNSGSTNEITNIIDPLHRLGCTIVAMTGNMDSPLAKRADYALSIHVDTEACPLGLAPTTSTTATLLMGDALMVCLMEMRNFKAENFGLYHPGGALGRQLMGRVSKCMTTDVPHVQIDTPFRDVVREMTDKHLGMTMVYHQSDCVGIITDGDVRRAILKYSDVQITAADIMTPSYKHISKDALLTDALAIMDKHNITTLAVTETEETTEIIGIISIHHIIDFQS